MSIMGAMYSISSCVRKHFSIVIMKDQFNCNSKLPNMRVQPVSAIKLLNSIAILLWFIINDLLVGLTAYDVEIN